MVKKLMFVYEGLFSQVVVGELIEMVVSVVDVSKYKQVLLCLIVGFGLDMFVISMLIDSGMVVVWQLCVEGIVFI